MRFENRTNSQFFQLRATLLVDPSAMRKLAKRRLPRLSVEGKTLGEVLQLVAQSAGLRMVLEDEVVWLRPK